MKKIVLLLICIFSMLHITACDCTVDFTISFMVDGEAYYTLQTSGETLVKMPTNPTKEGYSFKGWFWDDEIWEIPFTVNSLLNIPLQSDMCVYAKFEQIHVHDLEHHEEVSVACEEEGCLEYWSCKTCEAMFADINMNTELSSRPVIFPTGHNIKIINGRNPSCSSVGYTEGQECTICGEILLKQKEIAKLPHKFDREVPNKTYIKAVATCSTPTEYYYSCVCGRAGLTTFYYGNVVAHTYVKNEYISENIYHSKKCDNCTHSINKEIHSIDANNKCIICEKQLNTTTNLSYVLSSDKSYYTLTGIGYATDTDIVVPKTINNIPVKVVGDDAFTNNTNITSVWLSSNVTTINNNAFSGCSNLEYVYFGNSVTQVASHAFSSCKKLDYVNMPKVTSVGNYAFSLCSALTNINMPKVESVGKYVFDNCTNLKEVDLSNASSVGAYSFQYCSRLENVVLGSKITSLSSNLFMGCSSLKLLRVPNSVTNISSPIIKGCTSLTTLELPRLTTHIGDLYGITISNQSNIPSALNKVIIDSGMICDDAFKNCKYIQSVILNSVTTIGENAFYNCEKLAEINLGDTIVTIGNNAFTNTLYYKTNTNWLNNLLVIDNYLITCRNTTVGSVTIPNGVKLIAYKAFDNCDNILSVECPDTLLYIDASAFNSCDNLESVYLGDSLKIIRSNAFNSCVSLKSIIIPNSLESVEFASFIGCTALNSVYVSAVNEWLDIMFIGANSNPLCNGADLYVNNEKLENLVVPSNYTIIKQNVLYGCTSVKTIYLHKNVVEIQVGAFNHCINLEKFECAEGLQLNSYGQILVGCTSIQELILSNVPYDDNGVEYIKYLFNNNIPETLTSITINGGDLIGEALEGCANLKELVLNNVGVVGFDAFSDSKLLESVTIKGSCVISNDVFKGCTIIANVYTNSLDNWLKIYFTNCYSNPLAYGADLWVNGTKVTNANITNNVNQYAFYGCNSIEKVYISNAVTSIGKSAFSNCHNCKILDVQSLNGWLSVVLENNESNPMNQSDVSNKFYVAGEQVIDIVVPSSVTKINSYSFYGCDDVRSLYVPTSVTSIGYMAFGGCYFMDVTFPRCNDNGTNGENYVDYCIGYYVEYLTISSGELSSFNYSPYLAYVTIGKEVTSIADSAFENSNLGTIDFEQNSKCSSIGVNAFKNTKISGITIPSSVSSLGTGVLSQCGYLREVDMSGYIGSIVPMWAFESCYNLRYVKLPETIKSFYEYAFSGCTSLTNIEIPKNAVYFAAGVFSNTGLREFTFNSGVTQVSNDMFSGCTGLERVVLADTITFIGSYAFSGCTSLSYLYLPNSVFKDERFVNDSGGGYYDYSGCIGYGAFSGCKIETIDAEPKAYGVVLYNLTSIEYRNPVTQGYTQLNLVSKN